MRLFALVLATLGAGPAASATSQATAPPSDIVICASDISQAALTGIWTLACDETSPGGVALVARAEESAADQAMSGTSAAADPADYFDVRFTAPRDTPYRVWLRLRAGDGAGTAGAVWVQFSDALVDRQPAYRVGTEDGLLVARQPCRGCASSDWGWRDGSWALEQPATVTFASGGAHTLRIQAISPGATIDQIVLSPRSYLNGPPGAVLDVTRSGNSSEVPCRRSA